MVGETGECLCGGVRFTVTEDPVAFGYCHCTRCQVRTGTAASANLWFPPGSVKVTQGAELVKDWSAGDGFWKSFCTECGSHLFSKNPDDPEQVSVRHGALPHVTAPAPAFRQFVADAAAWEPIPDDGVPRFDGRRPR